MFLKKWSNLNCKIVSKLINAPEYLSIEGHQDCLFHLDQDSLESTCIPSTRPSKCITHAWNLLQDAWDGEKCLEEGEIGKEHNMKM